MFSAPELDFEALLSRDYRPASFTRLRPNEKYHPEQWERKKKKAPPSAAPAADGSSGAAAVSDARRQRRADEETSRLVLSLVTQTPGFTRHLPEAGRREDVSDLLTNGPATARDDAFAVMRLPPAFHEVELGDWESKIDWEGYTGRDDDNNGNHRGNAAVATGGGSVVPPSDAISLLRRPRNPHLDSISFAGCLDETAEELAEKARNAPLILELGVAGQSVARHVYQNTVLSAQRPTPALKSDEYQKRIERDWSQPVTSTAEVSKGSLHADKDKMEALIAERQRKRAQMAKDKTNRVTEAMGTMALGGGKGRTITSSLMGPGGTERTGRPSRHMGSSAVHDTEYIEQLDMVNNHSLVRDLSKVLLREYHRPKLPLRVARPDLHWQFQIRYAPTGKKAGDGAGGASGVNSAGSYQSIMVGTHAGAVSKAKLRSEADLSPTEGKLVLMEYSEERPPIQLTKGMAAKIVNYYRGDKAQCPVSRGGGDRPARRKRAGAESAAGKKAAALSGKADRLPRLEGPDRETNIIDWVGKLPKKTQKDRSEKESIDVLPEGVTEMLHPKVHGPFIGEVEEGVTQSGLISNMFVAPIFRHEPESTDFLAILTSPSGQSRAGQRDSMGVVLRDFPDSVFAVGQTEPRTRVYAPNTQGEKNFIGPFVSYQIARALTRTQAREGHGMRFDELQDRVLPNLELPSNALRQRLKQVAMYDKNTQIWTTKDIGVEDYPGVDALGKNISPEGVAAFETACSASRRLSDLGIHQLFAGSHTVASVGVTMVYMAGQLNSMREVARKMKNLEKMSRSNKKIDPLQVAFYEKASTELDSDLKILRQKHEVAVFIYEQLQLAPWHLTGEFIEVHKKAEGTGMMKLTGLGDPSGQGWAFSFLRELDSKPSKSVGTGDLDNQIKKITGTEDDLRKLTMKQMAQLLRNYGMPEAKIATLKRWDRVHVIRDLSTKAASDGLGDGMERFARGEKMKLSEQKEMYRKRIQLIWNRQIESLSTDSGDKAGGADGGGVASADVDSGAKAGSQAAQLKRDGASDGDDSDDDSDDDDFLLNFEEEMMNRSEANQLVADHAREKEGEAGLGQLRAATQDQDLSKEARELAALRKMREEERAAQEGWQSARPKNEAVGVANSDRKVIRKRITKTHPDGRQTITFKFILQHEEVGQIMARLQQKPEEPRKKDMSKYEHNAEDGNPVPGHSMFEDDDDFEYSKIRNRSTKARGGGTRRPRAAGGRTTPRGARNLQFGKLKTKTSKEDRMRKRKREEEELEVYAASAKRKGTNNRRERGSIRDRRPHVIFAEKLESIRSTVEVRPFAGPFCKAVSKKLFPNYYEIISHPIDLKTIQDKIARYEYRAADALVKDFELMKFNAVKFNGQSNVIAQEAVAIYEFVRDQVESSREELTALEEAVKEQMSGKPKKKKKQGALKKSASASASAPSNMASVGGVAVNLGDLSQQMLDGIDSDSDESLQLDM